MKYEIKLWKAVIARLEGDSVAHEAELTVSRGEPMWGSRETIRESVRVEAAKRMNGGVTPSPPRPANVGAPSSSGGKQVSFDESSTTGFVEVKKKRAAGCKARRDRKRETADPVTAAAPASVPQVVLTSSPPTGAAMYSRVAVAPPPPPVPFATTPGRPGQARSRLIPFPPPAAVVPGPSRARIPTSSPFPNARERHITMRFDAGQRAQPPVTPEGIRI